MLLLLLLCVLPCLTHAHIQLTQTHFTRSMASSCSCRCQSTSTSRCGCCVMVVCTWMRCGSLGSPHSALSQCALPLAHSQTKNTHCQRACFPHQSMRRPCWTPSALKRMWTASTPQTSAPWPCAAATPRLCRARPRCVGVVVVLHAAPPRTPKHPHKNHALKTPNLCKYRRTQGCIELLKRSGVQMAGKTAAVVGRSNIVGLPVALLLQNEDATVTMVHSRTPNAGGCGEGLYVGAANLHPPPRPAVTTLSTLQTKPGPQCRGGCALRRHCGRCVRPGRDGQGLLDQAGCVLSANCWLTWF